VYTLPPTSSHLSFVSKANKVSENLWQAAKTFFSNIKYNRTFEEKLSCAHIMQKYTVQTKTVSLFCYQTFRKIVCWHPKLQKKY